MLLSLVNEQGQHVSLLQDYWGTLTDPAHLLTEITISIIFALLELVLVRWLFLKVIKPRLARQIHAEIDAEHEIEHASESQVSELTLKANDVISISVNNGPIKTLSPGDTYRIVRQ